MSASALDILTVLDPNQPLSFGQIALNADGVLEMRQAPPLQQAQFTWHGVPVRINLHQPDGAAQTICDIVADLGPLPFSAQNPELRGMLLALIRGFRAPADCKLMLGPRQIIWACQQTILRVPLTPAAVLTEIVIFLHHMGPVLELLRDVQRAYATGGQRKI